MNKKRLSLQKEAKNLARKHAKELIKVRNRPDYDHQEFDQAYTERLEELLEDEEPGGMASEAVQFLDHGR